MNNNAIIKLYGADRCHKTQFYINFLNETELSYEFLDVEINEDHAEELRGLYTNRKLNFPTITIGSKKLRNPKSEELKKWLSKLIPQ
ncbi:glutaredoxin family protein [Psychroserpens luteus]|uniref:Glutaredoxin family protein n=1 Tax=Psychroserpens luteus TaxID=1434066 RepID=A0ABW5ZVQ1_9FLAO|nr:glutaredoxin family protein [Psychroserpens luteus]